MLLHYLGTNEFANNSNRSDMRNVSISEKHINYAAWHANIFVQTQIELGTLLYHNNYRIKEDEFGADTLYYPSKHICINHQFKTDIIWPHSMEQWHFAHELGLQFKYNSHVILGKLIRLQPQVG